MEIFMITIIDNYDSFTYNLYQYIGTLNADIKVYRNDKITVEEVAAENPERIIVSPGPCYPSDAGICIELIQKLSGKFPILGVCLGHQAIGEAFGGKIVRAPHLMHGKADTAKLDTSSPLFYGLNEREQVGRYHSLIIENESLPECLEITAMCDDGCIMAIKHREHPTYGIQFHPESVLTPHGMKMIENFLNI